MQRIFLLAAAALTFSSTVNYAQPLVAIERQPGGVRVSAIGGGNGHITFEGASDLGAGNWDLLAMLPGLEAQQGWLHAKSALLPMQFYRALLQEDYAPPVSGDFRLIDHLGKSRELFYYYNHTNTKALVLIFTQNGCATVRQYIPTLNAQRNYFNPRGVIFWMIDSSLQDNRSNIVVEANTYGINMPILHDPAQVVAGAYGATKTPEAVCISKEGWSVFYRGSIDDRLSANATASTQTYLSNALVNFLASQPVSPIRTAVDGCNLSLAPRFQSTYAVDIAPIFLNKCFYCHSPGNIGPFAMTNHAIIESLAGLIKHQVLAGHMPPWFADPYYGRFSNDRSLTADETRRLIQWIDDGAPRGIGPDPLETASVPVGYPFAWPEALGTPDQILSIPVQSIKASGVEAYRYINVPTTFATDVWLRAAVVKPGNTKVVHHVLVFDGPSGQGLEGFFSGYVPGYDATPFPPNTGKFLPRGKVLEFQMHYITIGSNQTDQTQIGLYVLPSAPTYPLQTKSAVALFSIPPNTPDYSATAFYPSIGTLSANILLYEMSPHMHVRGSAFKYEVIYPNNTTEVLLSVPHYIFHWQTMHRFTQPKLIPRGSRIKCTAVWDNTFQNRELMNEYNASCADGSCDPLFLPTRTVGFGQQTYDEMFIGYFNFAEVP